MVLRNSRELGGSLTLLGCKRVVPFEELLIGLALGLGDVELGSNDWE